MPWFPAPLETIVGQPAERLAMPGDEQVERSLVDVHLGGAWLSQQKAFSSLPFAIPLVLARQHPDRVSCRLGRAIFLHLN